MKRSFSVSLIAMLFLATSVRLIAADYYYYDADNKKSRENITDIEADDRGTITIVIGGGARKPLKFGEYRRVVTPKPKEVKAAEDALEKGDFDKVLAAATREVLGKHRFLGWGATIASLRGNAYLGKKDYRGAEGAFRDGLPYANIEGKDAEGRLKRGLVESLYAQDKIEAAKKELDDVQGGDQDTLGFVYNMRGRLLEESGADKRQAVLKYMTVILVFKDASRNVRLDSYDRAIKLLEELRDVRANELKTRRSQEG